jgi:signal transduction histidine kinase
MFTTKEEVIFSVIIICITFVILCLFFLLIIHNYVKRRAQENKNRLLVAFSAAEDERNRISKELHDSIGIKLSFIKLELELLKKQHDQVLKEDLPNLVSETIQEVRMISRTQSSQYLIENGIVNELNLLVRNFMRLKGIDCNIAVHPDLKKYNNEFQVHLFRILQELLNNTLRHSNATLITLNITETQDELNVKYADNGTGMKTDEITGSGLKNILTRVELWGGKTLQPNEQTPCFIYNCIFKKSNILPINNS